MTLLIAVLGGVAVTGGFGRVMGVLLALVLLQILSTGFNMLLVRFAGPEGAATQAFEALKARRVLVKNVSKMHPLLANCLRLTVGTPDENSQLLAALSAIVSAA